jgi:hypothetical protein
VFLLHTSLSKTALQLFTCVSLDASGRTFLVQDINVECSDAAHVMWMYSVGLPALVVYGAGIPMVSLLLLRARRASLESKDTQRTYGFLYAGYTPSTYFWETCIMARKISFAVVTVFLAPLGLRLQVYSVIVVALLALLAHDNVRPYTHMAANTADQGSLIVTIMTMLGGLYLGEKTLSSSTRTFVTVCVVGTNALFLLLLFVMVARLRYRSSRSSANAKLLVAASSKSEHTGTLAQKTAAPDSYLGAQRPSLKPQATAAPASHSALTAASWQPQAAGGPAVALSEPQLVRRGGTMPSGRQHALHKGIKTRAGQAVQPAEGQHWHSNPLQMGQAV